MIVSNTTSKPVPEDQPLVYLMDDGSIAVYPGGLGTGPMMIGSFQEWQSITRSVQAALVAANRPERLW